MAPKDKGWSVEIDTQERICFLRVYGFWDEADGVTYAQHLDEKLQALRGKPFDIVADIGDFPLQKPEVTAWVQKTMAFAVEYGMQRAANVARSAITELQIRRISEETGLPAFSFFETREAAVAWLKSAPRGA